MAVSFCFAVVLFVSNQILISILEFRVTTVPKKSNRESKFDAYLDSSNTTTVSVFSLLLPFSVQSFGER
ncbi:hypothetical protein Scep_012303 [Stephania cephalantha]|uniref:Secreted protein n=1 Tax=Stephania cephalantha TaxID=152367 RepID=A0AAP0P9E1_9MAGN